MDGWHGKAGFVFILDIQKTPQISEKSVQEHCMQDLCLGDYISPSLIVLLFHLHFSCTLSLAEDRSQARMDVIINDSFPGSGGNKELLFPVNCSLGFTPEVALGDVCVVHHLWKGGKVTVLDVGRGEDYPWSR